MTCYRTSARGNPLNLFIAKTFGTSRADVSATAIGLAPASRIGTRFLIDSEMFAKDLPAIQQLASSLGKSPDDLLTARGFRAGKNYGSSAWTWMDNFLDIPPNTTLSLPTGQGTSYSNNDSGLFDITHSVFPFTSSTSFLDFLMYSETGGDSSKWGTDNSTIKSQLDPLKGVSPVWDGSQYSSFVNPDYVHVSPVFFGDVSTLNMSGTTPQVNAKGLRRGLIAFKITAVGTDADGSGSQLPHLIIKTVDPATVNQSQMGVAGSSGSGSSGGATLVQ